MNSGLQKPDIVGVKDGSSIVVDAQVATDSIDLERAHATKREKYNSSNLGDVISHVFTCEKPKIFTCTLNWKGRIGKTPFEQLLSENVIRKSDLKNISTRALIGGIIAFHIFNKDTRICRRRPPR